MVFLVTDALPCGYLVDPQGQQAHADVCACDDLWNISSQYTSQNLTLVIIGLGKFACVCAQLFTDIAEYTGKASTGDLVHALHSSLQVVAIFRPATPLKRWIPFCSRSSSKETLGRSHSVTLHGRNPEMAIRLETIGAVNMAR